MGSYHGVDGFREFSHKKAVFSQIKADLGPLKQMRPPYGAGIKGYLDSQIKR
jgi:coniferyl-aldehyde dehydrogenase